MNIKRTCFVIMPYDKKTIDVGGETTEVDFDKVYEAIIEPAIASLSNPKLFCLRADRDQKTGIVSAKVMSHIQESAVCVVDVSGDNPNVYYELGIRHALSRGVTALIGYKGTALPFNVRGIAVLNYGYNTDEEVERAKTALREYISGSYAKHEVDSPVHRFLDLRVTRRPQVCERHETVDFSLKSDPTKSLGYATGEIIGISGIDVWVNSENTSMEMARYQERSISSAIRYYGAKRHPVTGEVEEDTIYRELRRLVKDGASVPHGQVIVTTPGSLRNNGVKRIFHVAAVQGNPTRGFNLVDPVGDCVTRSLERLDAMNAPRGLLALTRPRGIRAKSILFPLFGTGQARADPEIIVDQLVSAAVGYMKRRNGVTFKHVYFLAFLKEHAELLDRVLVKFEDDLVRKVAA